MTKRIFKLFLLLALIAGFYAMTAKAKGDGGALPTQTAQASQTAKPETCEVITGVEAGTVNLRSCAGTSCGVVAIVNEGESLKIVTAGLSTGYASLWLKVKTLDGVTGFINSMYCKEDK